MHPSVYTWVSTMVELHGLRDLSCLDVGSYATDALKVRSLFTDYLGIDERPGPNVDEVCSADELVTRPFGRRPVVVSTEMLEHCERPWQAVAGMAASLAGSGWLLLTARGYDGRGCYPIHDHPRDFWRFSEGAMRALVEDAGLVDVRVEADPDYPGWFLSARKP